MGRATAIAASFLALHLITAYWNPLCLWGVDALAYHPNWAQTYFALAGALLLVPRVHLGLIAALSSLPAQLDPWHSRASLIRASVALACLALVVFIIARSVTHLLGDGLLFVRELGAGTWQHLPRADRAPLAFAFVGVLYDLGASVWSSAADPYRILSVASGVLYVLLALQIAHTLGSRGVEKALVLGLLLTTGSLQLFFGYVENYPLLHAGILFYLLLSLHALRGRLPTFVPAAVLGILVPLHFTATALVPSLLVLANSDITRVSEDLRVPVWLRPARALLCLVPFAVASLAIFVLIGFRPLEHLSDLGGFHVLPLLAEAGEAYHYGLLSWSHMLDVLNQMLLVVPSTAMVLCLGIGRPKARNPVRQFLLTASVFPILFALVANPSIGAFRDWDVFAIPALPLTLWTAVALIDRVPDRSRLARIGILICGASLLHTAAWIGVNARVTSAETRFAALLVRCHLSEHARSYGWETLGIHYLSCGRTDDARQAYEHALQAAPRNPRHWTSVGSFYFGQRKYEKALVHYKKAISLRPDHSKAHASLGRAYHEVGDYAAAVRHYRKAIDLTPADGRLRNDLGNTFYILNDFESAVQSYRNAVTRAPGFADAHSNLAAAAFQLRRYQEAIDHGRKAVDLQPDMVDAYLNMGAACRELGRMDRAKACFQKVLELNPNDPQAPTIRQWLEDHP
ncbi:MAG: tetratricopeptide repeat protein [Candidatus Latescibacteria bacterium]|nr:tetratricopeptide repeat protein [Candidatus Latescibacterota bacterium]